VTRLGRPSDVGTPRIDYRVFPRQEAGVVLCAATRRFGARASAAPMQIMGELSSDPVVTLTAARRLMPTLARRGVGWNECR
jgi:hypothetical protein